MDPIADMFSQIKNAQYAQKESLTVFYSKIKLAILNVLKEHHQIADFRAIENKDSSKKIEIVLLKDVIFDIKKISRPGRRVYTTAVNIPRPKKTRAIVIISTSQGILEGETARKKGLGGEVIAEIK